MNSPLPIIVILKHIEIDFRTMQSNSRRQKTNQMKTNRIGKDWIVMYKKHNEITDFKYLFFLFSIIHSFKSLVSYYCFPN